MHFANVPHGVEKRTLIKTGSDSLSVFFSPHVGNENFNIPQGWIKHIVTVVRNVKTSKSKVKIMCNFLCVQFCEKKYFLTKQKRLTDWYPFNLKRHKDFFFWFLLMISFKQNCHQQLYLLFFLPLSLSLSLFFFFFHVLWMANQNRRRCSLIVTNNLLSFQIMLVMSRKILSDNDAIHDKL